MNQLKFIKDNPGHPLAIEYQQRHAASNQAALKESRAYKKYLIDIEALKVYALHHPEKTGKQLQKASGLRLAQETFAISSGGTGKEGGRNKPH